jgi:acyl transferase domain-containing protein
MGRELFEGNTIFRKCMEQLDRQILNTSGYSVLSELYSARHKKSASFEKIQFTHPAIFMVEYSLAQTLIHTGIKPDMTLGVSLGSMAAATVSGLVDVESALKAVLDQARIIDAYCEPGGMIAVLGDPELFQEEFLAANCELVAINFSSHFVVSAIHSRLPAIEDCLRHRGVTHQRLPVTFAFHSRWMEAAMGPFNALMQSIQHSTARLPMMCCCRGSLLSEFPPNYFWEVVRRPMQFPQAIAQLESNNVCRYIDVGPSGTLSTFLKYGLSPSSGSKAYSILTPYGQDQKNFAALFTDNIGAFDTRRR